MTLLKEEKVGDFKVGLAHDEQGYFLVMNGHPKRPKPSIWEFHQGMELYNQTISYMAQPVLNM